MRRILVLFSIVLEMSVLKASNFFVDGLGYTFIKDGEVEVTDQCFDTVGYSGKLVIPAYVPYGGGMHKVTRIGDNAIHSCHSLTSVTIPETVVAIGDFAFWNCTNLDSVVIPNSVLTIARGAFQCCIKLKSVVLSENLVVLGDYVFEDCHSLPSLTIPKSVKYIGEYLTYGCERLKDISIPASVVEIGRNVWEGVRISYVADNVADFCRLNAFNSSVMKGAIAGDSISYIIDGKEIETIVIPDTVKTIAEAAFTYCHSLKSVTILKGVETIKAGAFFRCKALTNLVLPESVKSVAYNAFSWTSISYICCYASIPPEAGLIFRYGDVDYYEAVHLYVPCESLEAYQQHSEWGSFQNIMCVEDYRQTARKLFYDNQVIILRHDATKCDMAGRVLP
ncbi:MAG: leucine-rich repeat domain-containing protein [Paludibacteraceae bacterium]|nr:leucine-rich repeat domain-containing protein [Paludibacteraceae bacterium]